MNKNITAPCEACGGLLPLKPIQTRGRGKQRQSQSLQPNQEKLSQPKDVSRSKDSHSLLMELGSASQNKNSADLEYILPSSKNSDSETDESSGKKRSYDSVLEEIQAIFAGQKVKKETISPYIHRDHRQRERKSNKPKQHERSQAHQRAISEHASTSKSRSASDINLTCLLHPYQRKKNTEPTCKRIVGPLPPDDASNCSFDPLSISPSPNVHAAQSCTHHLGEHSKRSQTVRGEAPAACSSPPCGVSTKQKNHEGRRHVSVDNHQQACRPASESSAERNTQTRMDNDCYHDVLRLYEECHIHQIDEHITATLITSPKGSRKAQRHSYAERGFQTQPQQIIYSCHQHVCQQTVVRHHEGCHLYQRDDSELPAFLSPRPRNPRKCQRCGCPERDYPAKKDVSLQTPPDHSSKAYVKTVRSPEQEVIACAQRLSSCKMHGHCSQQKMDVCGVCCLPKRDHKDLQRKSCEDQNYPICKHPCKDHDTSPRMEKIQGCHRHGEPRPPSPKCQEPKEPAEPKDPLVWTPRRVWKPRPCSVHWLDRITASQRIPSHIIRQYLQGKRRCPPRVKKLKCLACVGKLRDGNVSSRDPCQREVAETWNSGSDIAESTVECKEKRRGKLSRLALSRTLIVKPVAKVSTSQGLWTRKEFEVCSECRDSKSFRSLGIRSGRWSSILEEMSSTGLHDGGDFSSNCSTKYSCHTVHGLSIPCDSQAMNLRCPELFSAFRLRSKLQKLQSETFDRRAAMQIAQMEGIELDKEVFDLLPETKNLQKGSPRKSHKVCRRKRWEVYRGLCKIVEPPIPVCQQCPPRDVGVQVNKRDPSPAVNIWDPSDFCPEVQSSLQPSSPNPTNWPEQEQPNCQPQEQSLDEQHWAYLVEACKQARMAQGVFGICHACQ